MWARHQHWWAKFFFIYIIFWRVIFYSFFLCWRFFGFITLRKLYSKIRHFYPKIILFILKLIELYTNLNVILEKWTNFIQFVTKFFFVLTFVIKGRTLYEFQWKSIANFEENSVKNNCKSVENQPEPSVMSVQ